MKTQEQIQEARYERLRQLVENCLSNAYGASFDTPEAEAQKIWEQAEDAWHAVLAHYSLRYFNPGEPVAIPEKDWAGLGGVGPSAIPLPNGGDGLRTCEEEEAELGAGDTLLPEGLYWARLRLQQASDILEHGWAHGLTEPPAHEPFVLDLED